MFRTMRKIALSRSTWQMSTPKLLKGLDATALALFVDHSDVRHGAQAAPVLQLSQLRERPHRGLSRLFAA